jgi:hypothetical protein
MANFRKLFIGSVFILALCCAPLGAQEPDEIHAYQQAVKDRSILYRGEQFLPYTFRANGNQYWENDTFKKGDITFEGNLYHDVLINVDANAQRVLVQLPSNPFAVTLAPELVSSFTMGGRRFEGVGPDGILPEGIYEIIGEGPERVYKRVDKPVLTSTNYVNGDPIGYNDKNYRSDTHVYFAMKRSYFFRDAEGRFTRLKGKRALLRHFPERRAELRKAVKNTGLKWKDFDACCELVLKLTSR